VVRLSTAFPVGKQSHGFVSTDRPSSDVLFRRARRHSRRVRLLRVLVPILIAAGLLVSGLVVWLNPMRMLSELPVNINGLSVSGTMMTMTRPRLPGFTRDGRRYELTANSASQDLTNTDVVNLDEPRAFLEMTDQTKIDISAKSGVFDRKAGMLTLRDNIVLTSSDGQQMLLNDAVVDMRAGSVITEKPVEVRLQQGTIKSNRFEVLQSGDIIRFDGGVIMDIVPAASEPADKKAMQQ
jgi:lipopolysaccharide export system protein LptC